MPNATVKKVSEICDKPIDEVEKLFSQAEELAKEQGKEKNYSYIMGIFKKSLGKECLAKLKWDIEESIILNNISNLITESLKIKISKSNKLKICQEIYKEKLVKDNIKKFNLVDDVNKMCSTLEINNITQSNEVLHIVIFPKDSISTTSYLGDHICTVEVETDFSKFYSVSFDG